MSVRAQPPSGPGSIGDISGSGWILTAFDDAEAEEFLRGRDNIRWKRRISFPSWSTVSTAEPSLTHRLKTLLGLGICSGLDANRLYGTGMIRDIGRAFRRFNFYLDTTWSVASCGNFITELGT